MEAYSKEFRRDVLRACDSGKGTREVAVAFKVSESWIRRIKQVRRELGRTAPRTTRRRIPKWHAESERIASIVSKEPDLTLSELQSKLKTKLSLTTLCVALRELKLTFKKKS
jgi:transposase